MTSIQELEQRLQQLESVLKEKDEQYNRLMVDSRRALDLALHAYKVDHYGYIWTFSPDDGLYHKTNMRVATPEIADRAIQTRHLVSKCVTSEKIADKAVTRDKLTDEVINELRMVDIQDLYFGDYYTKEEVEQMLQNINVKPDLSNYYTKQQVYNMAEIRSMLSGVTVDLSDYYKKEQTYSQAEVNQLIAALKSGRFEPVAALPEATADRMSVIYLVPSANSEVQNVKDEYIVIKLQDNTYSWEQIGSTAVDLSGYATKEWVNGKGFLTEHQSLVNYYSKAEIDNLLAAIDPSGNVEEMQRLLNGKQDAIDDLQEIRENATDGAAAHEALDNKVDKVTGNNLEDYIAVLKNGGGIKKGDKKLSDLALKSDINDSVGVVIPFFDKDKNYAVDELCVQGVAQDVYKIWKCTTAHQGAWDYQHFEDVTESVANCVLVVDSRGRIVNTDKKVSDFLTEHQSLANYALKSEVPAAQIQADWNQTNTEAKDYIKNKPTIPDTVDVSGKADRMSIVAASGTSLNAEVDTMYRFGSTVNTLNIVLPTPTDTSHVHSVIVYLKTGDTPNISLSPTSSIAFTNGDSIEFDSSTDYELNFIFNGVKWILAYAIIG